MDCKKYLILQLSSDKTVYKTGEDIWIKIDIINKTNSCFRVCNRRFTDNFHIYATNVTTNEELNTNIQFELPPIKINDFIKIAPYSTLSKETKKESKINITHNTYYSGETYDPLLINKYQKGLYIIKAEYDSFEKIYFKDQNNNSDCPILECYLRSNDLFIVIEDP